MTFEFKFRGLDIQIVEVKVRIRVKYIVKINFLTVCFVYFLQIIKKELSNNFQITIVSKP